MQEDPLSAKGSRKPPWKPGISSGCGKKTEHERRRGRKSVARSEKWVWERMMRERNAQVSPKLLQDHPFLQLSDMQHNKTGMPKNKKNKNHTDGTSHPLNLVRLSLPRCVLRQHNFKKTTTHLQISCEALLLPELARATVPLH